MLELEDVCAGYAAPVVGPLTLRVQPGEVVGLAGANGVGKSTLLKAITGQARVFSGQIRRDPGLRINHHWQRPEKPPEIPLLGRELMELLNADPSHLPDAVKPLLDWPISATSGGQFQLLQACACLCSDAQLVLLDEVTNNLDNEALRVVGELLRPADHRGVLLISHDPDFLQAHCTRIVPIGEQLKAMYSA